MGNQMLFVGTFCNVWERKVEKGFFNETFEILVQVLYSLSD